MKRSTEYLEDALKKLGDMPAAEKAKALKLSPQSLSNYLHGVSKMDNFACIMVGRYLGIDPMKIIAACEEERAKSEEKQGFWRDFQKQLGQKLAVGLAVTTMAMMNPAPAEAGTANTQNGNVYYVKFNRQKRMKHLLFRLLHMRYNRQFAYA